MKCFFDATRSRVENKLSRLVPPPRALQCLPGRRGAQCLPENRRPLQAEPPRSTGGATRCSHRQCDRFASTTHQSHRRVLHHHRCPTAIRACNQVCPLPGRQGRGQLHCGAVTSVRRAQSSRSATNDRLNIPFAVASPPMLPDSARQHLLNRPHDAAKTEPSTGIKRTPQVINSQLNSGFAEPARRPGADGPP